MSSAGALFDSIVAARMFIAPRLKAEGWVLQHDGGDGIGLLDHPDGLRMIHSIAEVAHAWGCLTRPTVPDFTRGRGSI